jgi:hypothetical protein
VRRINPSSCILDQKRPSVVRVPDCGPVFDIYPTGHIGKIKIFMSKSVIALYPINIHREDRDEGAAGQHRRIKQAPCIIIRLKDNNQITFGKLFFCAGRSGFHVNNTIVIDKRYFWN